MATFTLFHEALENIGGALINLNTDTFKAVLSSTAPVQGTSDELADITQIAQANGYSTGGVTLTSVAWVETGAGSGTWSFTCDDISWTASGGDIATHRYMTVYSDTSTGDKLVGFVDRGAAAVITDGNSRTWDVGTSGLFQATVSP